MLFINFRVPCSVLVRRTPCPSCGDLCNLSCVVNLLLAWAWPVSMATSTRTGRHTQMHRYLSISCCCLSDMEFSGKNDNYLAEVYTRLSAYGVFDMAKLKWKHGNMYKLKTPAAYLYLKFMILKCCRKEATPLRHSTECSAVRNKNK